MPKFLQYPASFTWKNWSLGGEYVKRIPIKNITDDTLTITYELPKTKNFFMEFPPTKKLSKGMVWWLDVKLRPTKFIESHDELVVVVKGKARLKIRLQALLPRIRCVLPNEYDFGYCPVGETREFSFPVKNVGELPVDFNWDQKNLEGLFQFKPSRGSILPGKSKVCTVYFSPKAAVPADIDAILNLSDDFILKMRLVGYGKYVFISSESTEIDFGETLVSRSTVKPYVIQNKSLVPAKFSVHQLEHDMMEEVFSFSPRSGVIPPNDSVKIEVTYTPTSRGFFDSNNFEIQTIGGNRLQLLCSGNAVGPVVSINSNLFDFGDIKAGRFARRLLEITNHSSIHSEYCIQVEKNSPFHFEKITGILAPQTTAKIPIQFSPKVSMNYYERIHIMLRNQAPLFFDMIGTAYSDSKRPAPFNIDAVYRQRLRQKLGIGKLSPEEIEDLLNLENLNQEEVSSDQYALMQKLATSMKEYSNETTLDEVQEELFQSPSNQSNAVSLQQSSVDFGSCSAFRMSTYQRIRIYNNSNSKMISVPMIQNTADDFPFAVFPQEQEILPNSFAEFKVGFRPQSSHMFYHEVVSFNCYYKVMRTFRLVTEDTFVPPISLKVKLFGNTYPDPSSIAPKVFLNPSSILTFPPVLKNHVVYRTAVLRNTGDVPMPFEIFMDEAMKTTDKNYQSAFSVEPRMGTVDVQSFVIVLFRFSPLENKKYRSKAKMILNSSAKHVHKLDLFGIASNPSLKFVNDNKMYLKPTHVGAKISRHCRMINPSRVPAYFTWNIPKELDDVFHVSPREGSLESLKAIDFEWEFEPREVQKYIGRIPLVVKPVGYSQSCQELSLTIVGEGTEGGLEILPKNHEFKPIAVGHLAYRRITLMNHNDCQVPYELIICEKDQNGELILKHSKTLYCKKGAVGVISARSHIKVDLTFAPKEKRGYNYHVYCCMPLQENSGTTESLDLTQYSKSKRSLKDEIPFSLEMLSRYSHCEFSGRASYPVIGITDLYCEDYSKSDLWNQFSVNQINNRLTEFEKPLPHPEKEISFKKFIHELDHYSCDFSSKVLGSKATTVVLKVENVGSVDAHYSFGFCNDKTVDVDRWAQDEGRREEQEERELYIVLNEIFTISPKQGSLKPGESQAVTITYQHISPEIHTVPLLLRILDGNSLVFDLTGQTLNLNQIQLHFSSLNHEFKSVVIGEPEPPLQYYPLKNMSNHSARYTIDVGAIEALNTEAFNFPIFSIENIEGVIPPRGIALLRCIFNPLEAKMYEVSVPIVVEGGDTYFVTLQGKGLLPNEANGVPIEEDNDDPTIHKVSPVVPQNSSIRLGQNSFADMNLDVIAFDIVPAHSIQRRFVTIANTTEDGTIEYKWDLSQCNSDPTSGASILSIEPEKGIIEAGDVENFKVTLQVGSRSQIVDSDIFCGMICKSIGKDNHAKDTIAFMKKKYESIADRSCRPSPTKSLDHITYKSNADTSFMNSFHTEAENFEYTKQVSHSVRITFQSIGIEEFKFRYPAIWDEQFFPNLQEINYYLDVNDTHNGYKKTPKPRLTEAGLKAIGKDRLSHLLENLLQDVLQDDKLFRLANESTEVPFYCNIASIGSEPVQTEQQASPREEPEEPVNEFSKEDELDEDLLRSSGSQQSQPVLDFEGLDEREKMKQYQMEMEDLKSGRSSRSTEKSMALNLPSFKANIEWILDETIQNILAESLVEEDDGEGE